ncbi:MAG: TIR domain-containing protein [Anaerolineae bacterium]|nr:TIR domain-containing protein [Anaerolineae bacterium]
MVSYLTPGIYIEEIVATETRPANVWRDDCTALTAAATEKLDIVPMGTAAFIGITARAGAADELLRNPTLVKSWREFVDQFGEDTGPGYLPAAVHGFFANGGPACIIVSLGLISVDEHGIRLPDLRAHDFMDAINDRAGLGAIRPGHEPGLLCIPDIMALLQQGALDIEWAHAIQQTMIDYCEYHHNCTAILDTIPTLKPDEAHHWRMQFQYDTSRAVLYYPWLICAAGDGRPARAVPPCGHIAGVMMRTQIEHGVQKTPANEILRDVADLELHVTRAEQEILNPVGINLVQATPEGEIRVWGARTLSSDSAYRLIKTRRVMMTAQRSIERAVSWAIFATLDRPARERICCTIQQLLHRLWQAGALVGASEADAYYLVEHLDPDTPSLYVVETGLALDAPGVFKRFRVVFFTDDVIPDLAEPEHAAPDYSRDLVDEQPPPDIFVSYSRKDWDEFVEPLVASLRENGLSIWVDQHLLQGGQDWMDEINHALKLCRLMILCVSPDALQSRYVKLEYRQFFNTNKPILPVICHPAELPAELGGIQYLPYAEQDTLIARARQLLAVDDDPSLPT